MNAQYRDGEELPHEIAAGWVARQRSGAMTDQEAQDLQVWLDSDPEHRSAFEHVQGVWRTTAALRTDPQIMGLRDAALKTHQGRRRWYAAGGVAAALALALVGGLAVMRPELLPPQVWAVLPQKQVFSTGVGQTAAVTLQDGTVVTLDTDTRLRAREADGKRLVQLERGQAFFKVAHDPSRPFVVSAGGKTITALGTAFNVRLEDGRVEVILTEGRVKVSGAPPRGAAPAAEKTAPQAELTPGSRLVAAGPDDWRIARVPDVEEATSWRTGQLVFVRRPLGQVADELNRYSQKKVVIRDEALAAAPITGGFAAGDVDSFVEAVEGYGLASVASDTDKAIVLRAH